MEGKLGYLLFEDAIQINRSQFKVVVNIIQDPGGQLQYCALIDDVKEIELSINESGMWYDVNNGSSEISVAIGDLIERKSN